MHDLLHDLRFAVRLLHRSRSFSLVAVLSLALGIGANTAIFTVLDAALLRSLPVSQPEQLALVTLERGADETNWNFSYLAYTDYRDRSEVFDGLLATASQPFALGTTAGAQRVDGEAVSANYFDVLGVAVGTGRYFLAEEDQPGSSSVTVLSHRLWTRVFGGSADIIGQTIQLNGQPFIVIGVAPPSFSGLTRGANTELWTPLAAYPALTGADYSASRTISWLSVIGRLRPGMTFERARPALALLDARLSAEGLLYRDYRTVLHEARRGLVGALGYVQRPLTILMGAVALVLLIACANLANLALARARAREREIAVRLSLGASRGRIARQMLTESTLLAVLGGALGVVLAIWGADFLLTFRPPLGGPLALQVQPDARVLGFTFALSLLTGLAFGLGPALSASGGDLAETLREGRGTVGGRLGVRGALVVGQVAITLVLLAGAGLLVQTLRNLRAIDVGYAENDVLVARLSLETRRLSPDAGSAFFRELNERIAALPGVTSASLASAVPPSPGGSREDGVNLEGYAQAPDEIIGFDTNSIGTGYFETVGVRIVRGRAFDERDVAGATPVVIINESMAQRYWPGQNPIGRHVLIPRQNQEPLALQIVGIAQNGKYRELREDPTNNVYFPLAQRHRADVALLVQTRGDPLSLVPAVRAAVRTLDPGVPVSEVTTLRAHISLASSQERMVASLVSLFGALALGLAMLGVYGVVNYSVIQRTREIGVRMALGARSGDVLRMVVGRALVLCGAGIVLGISGGLALSGYVRGLVFGVSETDPVTFVAVALLVTAIAAVAAWLPARKAMRIDPLAALR